MRRDSPETSDRSSRCRARSRDRRRDPHRRSTRMGRNDPPLRITERTRPICDGLDAHSCDRPGSEQGHVRASPSDSSLRWPHRRRYQAHRAWSLRHHPVPTARATEAHTCTDEPRRQDRTTAASCATADTCLARWSFRAADAARLRLTVMPAHSRRQQPNKPMELHELASVMAARLLPSAVPGPVRPCPANRDTGSCAC